MLCMYINSRKFFCLPPKTPSLPSFRVNCCYPLETTGVDYAGPLYVKESNDTELKKCYILPFTCATFGAVHLETTRVFLVKV